MARTFRFIWKQLCNANSMPYQRAFIRYRSKIVFYAVSLNSNPRGKEAEVITSYFYIPQCLTTRRQKQHPRRFRPFCKIKRSQPRTLPKPCSESPACSLAFRLCPAPAPRPFLCAKVCRTVWGKSPVATVPEFWPCRLLSQTQPPELGHFSYVYATPHFLPDLNVLMKHQGLCLHMRYSHKLNHCLQPQGFTAFHSFKY